MSARELTKSFEPLEIVQGNELTVLRVNELVGPITSAFGGRYLLLGHQCHLSSEEKGFILNLEGLPLELHNLWL